MTRFFLGADGSYMSQQGGDGDNNGQIGHVSFNNSRIDHSINGGDAQSRLNVSRFLLLYFFMFRKIFCKV